MYTQKYYPYIFTWFFTVIFSLNIYAQKVKYKDVFELVKQKKYEAAYPLLKIVTKNDTSNASAALYLGNILYQKAMACDVLKENKQANIFCDSALYYLNRAKRQINEKEIRKNDDYYVPYAYSTKDTTKLITQKDTIFNRVTKDLNAKIAFLPYYKSNITYIFHCYTRFVNYYNTAATIYKQLNSKFKTEKELCLHTNDKIMTDLQSMSAAFDSCVQYFDQYIKLIKITPIGYNQSYMVIPIETYRLDGLSAADFLSDKCYMWNYKKWATDVKNSIDTDIKKIRELAIRYNQWYNTYIEKIQEEEPIPDSAYTVMLDKKFFSLLKKYDYQSVFLKLLEYKHAKWLLLSGLSNKLIYNNDANAGNIDAKSQLFFDMYQKTKICDSLINKLNKSDIKNEYAKYSFVFDRNYADADGLIQYIKNEKTFIQRQQNLYQNRYNDVMYGYYLKYADSTKYVSYGSYQIPLFVNSDFSTKAINTTCIKEDKKGNIYLGGYVQGNISTGFIAKLNEFKQVLWFKILPIKPENKQGNLGEFVSCIEPYDDECVVAVAAKTAQNIKTLIYKFDKSGNETSVKKTETLYVTRQLYYDALNDQYMLVCKGTTPQTYQKEAEQVLIACFDNNSVVKWQHKFSLRGTAVEFSKIFEGYLAIFNFSEVSTATSVTTSKAGESIENTNVFLLKISTNGQIFRSEVLTSEKPLLALGSVKISNARINILALQNKFTNLYKGIIPNAADRKTHVINSKIEWIE